MILAFSNDTTIFLTGINNRVNRSSIKPFACMANRQPEAVSLGGRKSSTVGNKKGNIRLFEERDLGEVAAMSRELIPLSRKMEVEQQKRVLRQLYLENKFNREETASLIYENVDGQVDGFLGVTEQPMIWKGQHIIAANSSHMMVRSKKNAALASIKLLKTLMQKDYDLCFADSATDIAKSLWEQCGGTKGELHSIYFRQMLKPHHVLRNHLCSEYLSPLISPLCKVGDTVMSHLPGSPFKFKKPDVEIKELEVEELFDLIQNPRQSVVLKPAYTLDNLQWRINLLESEQRYGPFKAIKMVAGNGHVAGWVLYHQKRNRVCEVLQLEAKTGKEMQVYQALCYHARQGGGAELVGRLDPRHYGSIGYKSTLFMPGFRWMLIHSGNPELIQSIKSGDAMLTRLEGDLRLV